MIDNYRQQLDKLHHWAKQARNSGWLNDDDIQSLKQNDDSQLVSLFKKQGEKPLIVAFFGGTGVGKSSLLNKIAGEDIARTGVQRPTSMEVTLYLHKDLQADFLPDNLPTESTRIAWHIQDDRRFVAWLDLPDMDSTARENSVLVEAWLPFVDWMIYVVSPERYHDDMGWRFLQSRGQQHAWIFIMNHWDQGTEVQLDDFRQKLQQENFNQPTILRSSCIKNGPADDFHLLEATIKQAIDQHGLSLLQSLGVQAQIENAKQHLENYLQNLDNPQNWQQAKQTWDNTVNRFTEKLVQQLSTSTKALSQGIQAQQQSTGKLHNLVKGDTPGLSPQQLSDAVWNHRSESFITDLGITLINQLQADQLPFGAFKPQLEKLASESIPLIKLAMNDETTTAMAKPGSVLQRFLFRLMETLSWLLPLTAAGWAVFHVASTYFYGTLGEKAFLGFDFAVHTGLLIGLSWLLPWLLKRKLKPSILGAIHRGLNNGIGTGKIELELNLEDIWQSRITEKQDIIDTIKSLQKEFESLKTGAHQQVSNLVRTPAHLRNNH